MSVLAEISGEKLGDTGVIVDDEELV